MIPEPVVATILDAARIEEVVGDFVNLKRRGANLIGLCPFHNERTPSFSVSPAKGIYKCFGCGASGSSAKFIMEHEKMTYPEALHYLAKKYHILIEEVNDEQGKQEKQLHDSLYVATDFARRHFTQNMLHTDEGQSVALGYFKERGFNAATIEKFQLGYSMEATDNFLAEAKKQQYNPDMLQKAGLLSQKDGRYFPFFRARVMFPVHNLSGKVVAFAGRTLSKDKKQPKYINSPETDIYLKSKTLYGLYFAKTAIRKHNECILVEGYTDVISMVQAGIENVVASSGTSLTQDQIRLINRYTPNITLLFDGDAAGIKAALRGVDLVLEEGLNVKIAVLPPDEDPDSFVQKHGKQQTLDYLHQHAADFVLFKTRLLLGESANDPIKKAELVKDIIHTIAIIPDPIKRAMYVKECSRLLDLPEALIINETNKLKWKKIDANTQSNPAPTPPDAKPLTGTTATGKTAPLTEQVCEREIVRVLLEFGSKEIPIEKEHQTTGHTLTQYQTVAACIIEEIQNLPFEKPLYAKLFTYYKQAIDQNEPPPTSDYFLMHPDEQISRLAIDLLSAPHEVSENWEKMHGIFITDADLRFKDEVFDLINHYKLSHVLNKINEIAAKIKSAATEDELTQLLNQHILLTQWKQDLAKLLRITIKR